MVGWLNGSGHHWSIRDAAVSYALNERCRLQVNVENVFDQRCYLNADSNESLARLPSRHPRGRDGAPTP